MISSITILSHRRQPLRHDTQRHFPAASGGLGFCCVKSPSLITFVSSSQFQEILICIMQKHQECCYWQLDPCKSRNLKTKNKIYMELMICPERKLLFNFTCPSLQMFGYNSGTIVSPNFLSRLRYFRKLCKCGTP